MPNFDTPGPVALDIAIPAGEITIETWPEPRVEVEVIPMRGDDGTREAAEQTRIESSERGGRHEITVRAPKRDGRFGFLSRSAELHVSVRCPDGAALEVTTQSADVDARGPMGDVALRSASGDVLLRSTTGLSFTTASGDLSAGAVAGSLAVKSASGDVDVAAVAGTSSVNTVSGDIRIGETADEAAVNSVSGDVVLRATEGGVRVSAVSGDVNVSARAGLSLWIDAQSVSGSVTSDLDVVDTPAGEAHPAELRIRTVSGDVRITTADARAG